MLKVNIETCLKKKKELLEEQIQKHDSRRKEQDETISEPLPNLCFLVRGKNEWKDLKL